MPRASPRVDAFASSACVMIEIDLLVSFRSRNSFRAAAHGEEFRDLKDTRLTLMAQDHQPTGGSAPTAAIWPRCGASAAIFRGDEVLLIERGKGALKGQWSLPGGHIEPGETARAAAVREVREETGVEVELASLVDIHEVILRNPAGVLQAHYLIAVFCGRWRGGEPAAGSDAATARFLPAEGIASSGRVRLTEGAAALIHRARAQLQSGGT